MNTIECSDTKVIEKRRIVRFILVGGISTFIDFIIYILISIWVNITLSKGISMICSSLVSYFANKNYTFSVKDKTDCVRLIKYYLVFMANIFVNIGMNKLVYVVTTSKVVAFLFATICGMLVNYLGQKFIVFVKK